MHINLQTSYRTEHLQEKTSDLEVSKKKKDNSANVNF